MNTFEAHYQLSNGGLITKEITTDKEFEQVKDDLFTQVAKDEWLEIWQKKTRAFLIQTCRIESLEVVKIIKDENTP